MVYRIVKACIVFLFVPYLFVSCANKCGLNDNCKPEEINREDIVDDRLIELSKDKSNTYPLIVERDGARFTFGKDYCEISFSSQALLPGNYGKKTIDGDYAHEADPYFHVGYLTVTPVLSIPAYAVVDVSFSYDASWINDCFPHECDDSQVFSMMACSPYRGHHILGRRESVTIGDLGTLIEIARPSIEDNTPGLYAVETRGWRSYTAKSIVESKPMKYFEVFIADVERKSSVKIKQIDVRITHKENFKFVPFDGYRSGFDPNINLLNCRQTGPLMTDCTLEPRELFPNQSDQSNFKVRYQYSCLGEPLSVVLKTDLMDKTLERSLTPQEITLTGHSSALWLEMKNPAFDQDSYVMPGCTLHILDVQAVPSVEVVDFWTKESEILLAKIQEKMNLLLLVNDLENITGWDDANISLLKNDTKKSIDYFLASQNIDNCSDKEGNLFLWDNLPDQCIQAIRNDLYMENFYHFYDKINIKFNEQPNGEIFYDVKKEMMHLSQSLQSYYKEKINQTYKEVLDFQKRLSMVGRQLNEELVTASSNIENMLKK